MGTKVAALDLGSNTFLCLIAEEGPGGSLQICKDLSQTVRLGQGVDRSRRLHPEALKRAYGAFEEFCATCKKEGVQHIEAVATSAARDASNGFMLFEMAESFGIPIRILSGNEEAQLSFRGSISGHLKGGEKVCVLDIGGGSTEVIVGDSSSIYFSKSLDLGGVRFTERYVPNQPLSYACAENLAKASREIFLEINEKLKSLLPFKIIAVGGTPTTLASLELGGYDFLKVDGFFLEDKKIQFWLEKLRTTTVEEKRTDLMLSERADILLAATSILKTFLELNGLGGCYVSSKGLRFGLAMDMLHRFRAGH